MKNIYEIESENAENSDFLKKRIIEGTPKPELKQYKDATGAFSNKQLLRSLWFVRHKVFFYRLAVGVLVFLSIGFFGYSIYGISDYAIYGYSADQKLYSQLAQFPDYTVFHPMTSAKELQLGRTQVLDSGVDIFDLMSEVYNPNQRFYVAFDYYFDVGGIHTPIRHGFLLPGETNFVAELGLSNAEYFGGGQLILKNLDWRRISNHFILDVNAWQEERLQFTASSFEFIPALSEESADAHIIKFDLRNNSAFGYKSPEFYIGLYNNTSLVGLKKIFLENFQSLSEVSLDLRSFVRNLRVNNVKIYPLLDVYSRGEYMQPPA